MFTSSSCLFFHNIISSLKVVRVVGLSVISLWLCACGATVRTQINAFVAEDIALSPSTFKIQAKNPDNAESLEFRYYFDKVKFALQQRGYEYEEINPIFRVDIDYTVQRVEDEKDPLRTGFVVSSGWRYSPFGTSIVMFDDDNSRAHYQRVINLSVLKLEDDNAKPVYQVTGVSEGSCGVLSAVFDEMLSAIMQRFPYESGTLKYVRVKGDVKC